ncbi:hypothetical protein D3C87_1573400 [compost metagenome]
MAEEGFGRPVALGRSPPEPGAAYLALLAGEAIDGPSRVLLGGLADGDLDPHPVPHHLDVPEGHPGLGHAEGSRVHAQEHDPLMAVPVATDVGLVARMGVDQRVVDVGDRRGEGQLGDVVAEAPGRS